MAQNEIEGDEGMSGSPVSMDISARYDHGHSYMDISIEHRSFRLTSRSCHDRLMRCTK